MHLHRWIVTKSFELHDSTFKPICTLSKRPADTRKYALPAGGRRATTPRKSASDSLGAPRRAVTPTQRNMSSREVKAVSQHISRLDTRHQKKPLNRPAISNIVSYMSSR